MQRERRHNARLAFNVTVNAHLVNRVIMVNNDIGQCEWIIEEVARGGCAVEASIIYWSKTRR